MINQPTPRLPDGHDRRSYLAALKPGNYPAPHGLPPYLDALTPSSPQRAAVIYDVSTHPRQAAAFTVMDAVSQGWSVADVCPDGDDSAHPSVRPGLRAALERLSSGAATALFLDEHTFKSMPDHVWLKAAVQNAGGVLFLVSAGSEVGCTGAASERALATDAGRFRDALVRPVRPCREDMG